MKNAPDYTMPHNIDPHGVARCGSEWDASLSYALMPGLNAMLKPALWRLPTPSEPSCFHGPSWFT